ncbi:DUF4928 family protein [Dyella telluris]|uniref:DUF4928 family protein n=2 Tax=Dyella telluris TaxID=2763498 RepID=A0A7G8QAE6_9GAMM|nr:DUF4928 family protein [Dyella telluris]
MLVVNEHAKQRQANGIPLKADDLLTNQGGQVLGLGVAAVQTILKRHGIDRVLAAEGGRTSRGSIKFMRAYVDFLNQHEANEGPTDLASAEKFWITKVEAFFAGKPFTLKLDAAWGIRMAVRFLTAQAVERQKQVPGTMFLGTLIQHLVGAKLDVVLTGGATAITHHGSNESDQSPDRHGDFDLEDVAIHVSTAPGEALIRKCQENLGKGKRPIIITISNRMAAAEGLLDNLGIGDRVDLIEFEQFIATNVFEFGRFTSEGRKAMFAKIVDRYNEVVDEYETDPSLRIELTGGK